MHPLFSEAKKSHSAKHSRLARGGDASEDAAMIRSAVAQHEKADHPGKPLTPIKLRKEGGSVEGAMSKPRNDRLARASGGGAKKKGGGGKTHVNVIIAPQGGGAHPPMSPLGAPPGGLPPGMPVHPPGPPMPPPGPPPMAGPGGPPGMPPPGGMPPRPPMMPPPGMPPRKAGGAVGRKHGGGVESYENKAPSEQGVGEVGSGGGLGRIAKIKAYGESAPKGGK